MEYLDLMRTMPPLVAALMWDVLNDRVTIETIRLADQAMPEEKSASDVVGMLAGANLNSSRFPDDISSLCLGEISYDEAMRIKRVLKVSRIQKRYLSFGFGYRRRNHHNPPSSYRRYTGL